jgi:serine/threonine-protein kinase HipA
MTTSRRCLVCYQPLARDQASPDYHARCARALFGTPRAPALDVSSSEVERLALEVVNRRLALTGVQRKLSLTLAGDTHGTRLTIVGALGGTHILKPPTPEYPHLPEIEDVTMGLAEIAGLEVARHGLIRMADGGLAYITRRFDRERGRKRAVEDLCQLSQKPTAAKYRSSAEKTGKIIRQHSSNPGDDALRYFDLTLFSFVTGNADMHLKNFSLIRRDDGMLGLSPAYDLVSTRMVISARNDPEELALPVRGRKRKLTRKDFLALGEAIELPPSVTARAFARLARTAPKLLGHIKKSFLPAPLQAQYADLVTARLKRLAS